MTNRTAIIVGLLIAIAASTVIACSNDNADTYDRAGAAASSNRNGDGGSGDGSSPDGPPAEERLFRALQKELDQKCGGACHAAGTYKPAPATFLAPPDPYQSIKAQPGVVVRDYYQSVLLQKGAHAGPAVSDDPTFEAKIIEWLKMESAVIQSQQKPSTDPVSIRSGANDIDLTKAAGSGLSGVHLLFKASLLGGVLSLEDIRVRAPAGTDVHVLHPSFVRVLASPDELGRTEVPDGADTFSNTDQTVPGGQDTLLAPGAALLTSAGWTPFDFGKDKVRVELDQLEPGKIEISDTPKTCKDVAAFTANVLPSLRGGGGFNLNCASCHGGGLAGLSLNGADQTVVCTQVLQKLDASDITKSIMVTKVKGPTTHAGGAVTDIGGWTALFVNNKGVFF